eukprot:scpid9112/ scgid0576/ 
MAAAELEAKLSHTEQQLHFTKQHHSIIVSSLHQEIKELRKKNADLNFRLCTEGESSASGGQDGRLDEVSHLQDEIDGLRRSNAELEASQGLLKLQLQTKECSRCARRKRMTAAIAAECETSDNKPAEQLTMTSSAEHPVAMTSSAQHPAATHADRQQRKPVSSKAPSLSLHQKSRSVPAGVVARVRRQLPAAPSGSLEQAAAVYSSRYPGSVTSYPGSVTSSSDRVTTSATTPSEQTPTDDATSSGRRAHINRMTSSEETIAVIASSMTSLTTPSNASEFPQPPPPSTPPPRNGRRSSARLLKSRSETAINARLQHLQLEHDEIFGRPPCELWELPRDLQLRAGEVKYERLLELHRLYPNNPNLPAKPRERSKLEYLISAGLLSKDGKRQLYLLPPRRDSLPPIPADQGVMERTPTSRKHSTGIDGGDGGSSQHALQDRNAYAGPRLATDPRIQKTSRRRAAAGRNTNQAPSGSRSAIDLTALDFGAMEESGADAIVPSPTGESKRRSLPTDFAASGRTGKQTDQHRQHQSRAAAKAQHGHLTESSTEIDVHDTALVSQQQHDTGEPVNAANHSSTTVTTTAAAAVAASGKVVAMPEGIAKVLASPYLAHHSSKLAARTTVRERQLPEHRATARSKDMEQAPHESSEATVKKQ